ncbi:alpha-galactosidase A-like isoform X2 [Gigantopelta aegis]|uniref:alpha-galactosidase A-like isoform X2 n=1 Tax=Gigantopelta aegis TaxID=1735272 RepID=UPI001B88D453|nr:alpha-galactosidase A-like isoform X2 [Gigantopelta aegis]
MKCLAVLWLCVLSVHSLNNGLARTPPMGFLSWERFRCNTDCKNDPDHCISENLYMKMADIMVSEGYRDLGYEYVTIDDCWLAKERDNKTGRLQPDPARFPHGIKHLAQYIHSKGLKFGIYEDYGTKTCAGYPGSLEHMKLDAQTFADWEVDLLKFDGCYSDPKTMDKGYPMMAAYLNATRRPILFACEWPLYQNVRGIKPNYREIAKYCNMWRNYDDIQDSWVSTLSIIDYYAKNAGGFAEVAAPGGFNDPDELLVGNFGLSFYQQKSQFGLWSIMASPLFMSTDLRTIRPEEKAILQNKRVIAINQDPLGAQGIQIYMLSKFDLWVKRLAPEGSGNRAFAILNRDDNGAPRVLPLTLHSLMLTNPKGYILTDAFTGKSYGKMFPNDTLKMTIDPTSIFLATAYVIT